MDFDKIIDCATNKQIYFNTPNGRILTPTYKNDKIETKYHRCRIKILEGRVGVVGVKDTEEADTHYIPVADHKIAVSTVPLRSNLFLASSRLTGCTMQFWHTGTAVLGAHVFYGASSKGLGEELRKFGEENGWRHLYEWKSAGLLDVAAGEEGVVLAQVTAGGLRVVVMKSNNVGKATVLHDTSVPF